MAQQTPEAGALRPAPRPAYGAAALRGMGAVALTNRNSMSESRKIPQGGNVVAMPLQPAPWTRDDDRTRDEWQPLLVDPGAHDMTLDDVERFAVVPFEGNIRRQRLMQNLRTWIGSWLPLVGHAVLLIDGSFLSSKRNPGDVDALAIVDRAPFAQLPDDALTHLKGLLLNRTRLRDAFELDVYTTTPDDTAMVERFTHTFGHARSGMPKGFARVEVRA